MACAITASDDRLAGLLAQRYNGFLSSAGASHFSIEVEVIPSREDSGSPLEIQAGPVSRHLDNHTLRLTGEGFRAEFDFKKGKGLIRQPLNLTSLDLLLKTLYSYYLVQEEAFFVHACALVRKGNGYLFFGPAGSGKSTLARLAGEGVLADELVIVRRDGSPDGLSYSVYGTPFWGGINKKAPLTGLFALHPDRSTFLSPLTPVEALRRLLHCLGCCYLSQKDQARLFGLAGLVVQQVPCYELHFSLEAMPWRYLDAHPL